MHEVADATLPRPRRPGPSPARPGRILRDSLRPGMALVAAPCWAASAWKLGLVVAGIVVMVMSGPRVVSSRLSFDEQRGIFPFEGPTLPMAWRAAAGGVR